MSLNEFDIIKKYFTRQACQTTVLQGVGDDCAVVAPVDNKQLVMSMDTLVMGTHFPEDATAYQIATRALCTSLSDLAAMGATPLWFTLGLTLPTIDETWLSYFSRGLFAIADSFNMDLIGGDTTRGPLAVTIQVHGEVEPNKALMRSTAQVGDCVLVTNTLGDGAAALAMLKGQYSVDNDIHDYLLGRFYQPRPQITVAKTLAPLVNSAIDISDGLLADAEHIAVASQVSIALEVNTIPIAQPLKNSPQSERQQLLTWALSGGDDYQLLITTDNTHVEELMALCGQHQVTLTPIGRVIGAGDKPPQVELLDNGVLSGLSQGTSKKGYQHFDA